jgi:hypothetical protein
MVRRMTANVALLCKRGLHLLDCEACLGAAAKGQSSLRILNSRLRHICALLLAAEQYQLCLAPEPCRWACQVRVFARRGVGERRQERAEFGN